MTATHISYDDRNRYGAFRRARERSGEPAPSLEEYLQLRKEGKIKRGGYFPKLDLDGLSKQDKDHFKNVATRINRIARGLA